MNKHKLSSAAQAAVALALLCFPAKKSSGQYQFENRLSPTIQMEVQQGTAGVRQLTSRFGVMDPIGLLPNEQIAINLIVPSNKINSPVGIGLLDGGEIFAPANLYVASNATVGFSFKGGRITGLYRVLVTIDSEQYLLQLYVAPPRDWFNCPPAP